MAKQKKISRTEQRRRTATREQALTKSSELFRSGKAKQTVRDVSTPILERSLSDIRTTGNPLGRKIAAELATRQGIRRSDAKTKVR